MNTLLLVDSSLVFLPVLKDLVTGLGFAFRHITLEHLSLDRLWKQIPEVILCHATDFLAIPIETLQMLRSGEELLYIPWIVIVDGDNGNDLRAVLQRGPDDLLLTPLTPQALAASISNTTWRQQRYLSAAEERMNEIRTFLTMFLPHELRTPLNGISGNAELLEVHADVLSSSEIKAVAQDIRDSSARLNRLFNNFLTYSQLEFLASDPRRLAGLRHRRTTHLREVLEVIARIKSQQYKREGDLELCLQDNELAMSEEYVRKVFDELLDNAFKFSQAGTPVQLCVRKSGPQLMLSVQDEGRGMSPEQIARIGACTQFERRQYEQQGSGLGLVIAKRLVELHQGQFHIESQRASGTRIDVNLPLSTAY